MRCKQCGWENPDGTTKCVKCALPLQQEAMYNISDTVNESNSQQQLINKTVLENEVFNINNKPEVCSCGYPLRPGVQVCPMCHKATSPSNKESTKNNAPTPSRNNHIQDAAETRRENKQTPFGGTILPNLNKTPDIWFSLTPLPIDGERETPEKADFEGVRHELNRSNIDPKNHTITSKIQAVIYFDTTNNRWIIQDKSAMQCTFLNCAGENTILNGDILLMGDRRFVFRTETNNIEEPQTPITGTIAVGRQRMNTPRCVLSPVADENEIDAPQEHMFRGEVNQLNRTNLDPENYTITSKVQAELRYEDNQWFIKDCSQLKTTYLLCKDPIVLEDGDRILMGNRVFVFNC